MIVYGSSMVSLEMTGVLNAMRGGTLVLKNNAGAVMTQITLGSTPGLVLGDNSFVLTGIPLITAISSTGAAGPATNITVLDTSGDTIVDQIPVLDANQDVAVALSGSSVAILYYLRVRGI